MLVGGRPRRGRAPRDRAARDRRADRAARPPERRAARAQRRLQRAPRARAGARGRWRVRSSSPTRAAARRRAAGSLRAAGRQAALDGRLDEAEAALEQARALFAESGAALTLARTLNWLGIVVWERRDLSTRRGDPARGDPDPEAARGPGNARREPAPARPGPARAGTARRRRAARARGARDGRRRRRLLGLDDAARPRARARRPGAGRRGRARSSARPTRSCGRPASAATGSRRSRRSPCSCARATARTRPWRSTRLFARSSASRPRHGAPDETRAWAEPPLESIPAAVDGIEPVSQDACSQRSSSPDAAAGRS